MAETEEKQKKRVVPDFVWVGSTYFAEGFPYSIVVNVANLYFIAMGASLAAVGLTSLFHLPWNLKVFVGPFFDQYGTKRKWLLGIEALLVTALIVFAFTSSLSDVLLAASIMFLIVAVLSASHDIAIDGFYLEGLDKKNQEKLVGVRAPLYRIAMTVVTGPIAFFCDRVGWGPGFIVMAVMMGTLFALHAVILPRDEAQKLPFKQLLKDLLTLRFFAVGAIVALLVAAGRELLGSSFFATLKASILETFPKVGERIFKLGPADWIGLTFLVGLLILVPLLPMIRARIERSESNYAQSFVAFLAQGWAGRILLYIVLFRVGESFLQVMKAPFLRNSLALSQAEYAVVNGTIGMVMGFLAPALGGFLIARYGFKRCIWPFLLAQNVPNLLYALAAAYAPEITASNAPLYSYVLGGGVYPIVDTRVLIVTTFVVVEIVGAGLGTAAFMVFILRSCLAEHKAAHMALLTSLMSVSFTLAGVFSGFLAEWMGFSLFFAFTFMITIPGMMYTLFVPHIDDRGAPPRLR